MNETLSKHKRDMDEVLRKNIKPEPFVDDCGRVGDKYTGGAYGEKTITSIHSPRFWKNEWELIPDEQKKELIDWINDNLNIDNMLYNQSLMAQSANPIVEHLVKDKVLPDIDSTFSDETIAELPEMRDIPEDRIHFHKEAKPFMEAFAHHKKESTIAMVFQPKKIRLGFMINDYEEMHFIKLATLQPIWSPPTQDELTAKTIEEKLASPHKSDEHINKMFQTTHHHSFGMHWAGILELNTAKLSTVINGMQHALKLKTPRYRIEWVNLKNPRDRKEVSYESVEISSMIEKVEIMETNGHEKAPRIYPETCQWQAEENARENQTTKRKKR